MRHHLLRAACLSAAIALLPWGARAQVFKCQKADGSTSFQGTPCPGSAKAAAAARPAAPAPASAPAKPYEDPYAQAPGSGQRGTLALSQRPIVIPSNGSERPAPAPAPRPQAQAERAPSPAVAQALLENQRLREENRRRNCAVARNNVAVLGEQTRVFRRDAAGNRQYIADEDRARELAQAQQGAAAACN
jgi:hypothetical protein